MSIVAQTPIINATYLPIVKLTPVASLLPSLFLAVLRTAGCAGGAGAGSGADGVTDSLGRLRVGSLQLGILHQILLAKTLDLLPSAWFLHNQLVLVCVFEVNVSLRKIENSQQKIKISRVQPNLT